MSTMATAFGLGAALAIIAERTVTFRVAGRARQVPGHDAGPVCVRHDPGAHQGSHGRERSPPAERCPAAKKEGSDGEL